MSDLFNKKCVPCEGGVLPFDISEIHKYQKKVDGWDIFKDEKISIIDKKRTLILINGNNELIWVVNQRIDDRYKLSDSTNSILKISFK